MTLTGQVDWDYQRRAARRAVENLRGVRAVRDLLVLTERPPASDAARGIRDVLARNADLDGGVDVTVDGTTATLTGTVRSWAERERAAQVAWASPFVTDVDNRIRVRAL